MTESAILAFDRVREGVAGQIIQLEKERPVRNWDGTKIEFFKARGTFFKKSKVDVLLKINGEIAEVRNGARIQIGERLFRVDYQVFENSPPGWGEKVFLAEDPKLEIIKAIRDFLKDLF